MKLSNKVTSSTLFLLSSFSCLAGCGEPPIPPQTASISTEGKGEFSSIPRDEGKKPEETELDYLLRRGGLNRIKPEEGGDYYFSNYFDYCSEDELPMLTRVEGLRTFDMFDGNSFSPAGWKQIGQISGLEAFNVSCQYVTDEHLMGLHGLSHLKDLKIVTRGVKQSPISDQGLQVLSSFPALRRLVLHSREINVRGCELIGDCTELRALELWGPITDECLKPLGKLKNLKHLIVVGTFSDAGLKHLSGLKQLTRLVLHSDQMTGSGLNSFAEAPELREFGFSGSPAGDTTLKQLDQLPGLVVLNLSTPSVNDAVLQTMPDLPQLEALSLKNSNITDKGLDALVHVKNLSELDLPFTEITNDGLIRLEPLQQLRLLVLGYPGHTELYTGKGLEPLTKLSRLEVLDIGNVNAEKLDLRPLARCSSLVEVKLNFGSDDVSKRWQEVQAERPELKRVQEIIPVTKPLEKYFASYGEIP
ncbi:leucine-rich repeat domain-containing protein [Gimesia sp.]|uniref:leucine-rich repeat domain-containing protein n=1 Tax=Gimesia sp. TaxID=2024833 RepID=UPI003A9065CF